MDRKQEIRTLLALSAEKVEERAGNRLVLCEDVAALHQHLARHIAEQIQAHNRRAQPTRLILPVGPTGQYPILANIIAQQNIPLANCWFFFMDEYCDEQGHAVAKDHPLSFKGVIQTLFLDALPPDTGLQHQQIIFPDQNNINALPGIIEDVGGIDVCYGGIGIHGHLAFNEPEPGVQHLSARQVKLNDFTVTINAVRAQVGGNLECFPRLAYTLGMKQILAARHIQLYCRNGCEFDWANTVLRLALLGQPGDDYPVTHIGNTDYTIVTDRDTLASPNHLL